MAYYIFVKIWVIQRADQFIRKKAVAAAEEFAERLRVSVSMVFDMPNCIKNIEYDI